LRNARRPPSLGLVDILYQDRHVVVALKPPGIDVHGRGPDDEGTLVALVAKELGLSPRRLHPASRLDRPVSGLVPLCRSKVGRKALTEQYQRRLVRRTYMALASAAPEPLTGSWDLPIGPDPSGRRRQWVDTPGAKPAVTRYETVEEVGGPALVELGPRTGRTHQLRVHLAAASCPILGDRRYGGPTTVTLAGGAVLPAARVLLHAARLSWLDPESRQRRTVEAPLPADMEALLDRLRDALG